MRVAKIHQPENEVGNPWIFETDTANVGSTTSGILQLDFSHTNSSSNGDWVSWWTPDEYEEGN